MQINKEGHLIIHTGVRPSSVETPVPSITEVKQHWEGLVLGWVSLSSLASLQSKAGGSVAI